MNRKRTLNIEREAERVRTEIKPGEYGISNIFSGAESIGYKVIRYPVGLDTILGFSMIKELDKIIFSNSSLILSREIFTVAHEIGHHVLHLNEQDNLVIRDDSFDNDDEQETEANHFAACLLISEDKLRKFIHLVLEDKPIASWNSFDVAKIQGAFNVSFDMVLNRLKYLNFIDASIYDKIEAEKKEQTATKLLKVTGGNPDLCKSSKEIRIPTEYLDWIFTNYTEKLIPKSKLDEALKYVGIKADDLVDGPEHLEKDEESIEDLLRGLD